MKRCVKCGVYNPQGGLYGGDHPRFSTCRVGHVHGPACGPTDDIVGWCGPVVEVDTGPGVAS